ncbi:MAG: glycoside hydrolase family 31 protein, partial [Tepidisphaeraceae bacterium]
KPFDATNLHATIRQQDQSIEWRPGTVSAANLGGTERTLDGWDGARKLSDGLLSRDGWYLLDDSHGVLLTHDWVKDRPANAGTDWYLFGYGQDYRAALRSLTTIGGPIPLPRRYMLGDWYSRYWPYTDQDYRQIVQEYADHHFPLDVLVLDMDWHLDGWTGYTWNPKLLKDPQSLLDWLHAQGLAVTLNDHPADGVQPHEAMYGAFMHAMNAPLDKPLPFDAGSKKYLDTFYAYTHRPLEKQGVDFWWLDWQQYPFTRSVPTLTNLAWLNHYYYQQTSADDRRGASFSRWAGWGDQRHPIHFSGDASTSFNMLAAEIPFTSTAGNVGCFFWSHDIGGHMRGRNEESYTRWCQFGAFSAALRSHSTRDKTMDRRPWTYPKWAEESMRTSFQLRSRFFTYTYSAVVQACEESVPFVRPVYLDEPSLEAAYHQPQEYLYGDNVLVAPVTEAGVGPNRLGRQSVWFPKGTWYNFFTNERFDGQQQALVAATIDEFPLYVRGGVPIPMRAVTQRMATEPLNELTLRCYPGDDHAAATAVLREDDGLTTAYRSGASAQTRLTYRREGNHVTIEIAPTVGTFAGQVQQRSVVIELPATTEASHVTIDGTPAQADYEAASNLNRIHVPARSIRQGCVVALDAEPMNPAEARTRAFLQRSGLSTAAAETSLPELLAAALAHSDDARQNAALCAAAGIGVFPRNEHVYGYPQQAVPVTFAGDALGARIDPITTAGPRAARQINSFQVTLGGKKSICGGYPGELVDWSSRAGNLAPFANITLSTGGPAHGLNDGKADGYPGPAEHEWASRREKAGAWAKLEWKAPQSIDRVVLFDRPNAD